MTTQSTVKFREDSLTVVFSEEKGVCFNLVEICQNIGVNPKSQQKKIGKKLFVANGGKYKTWGKRNDIINWVSSIGRRGLWGASDEKLMMYKEGFASMAESLSNTEAPVESESDTANIEKTIEMARKLKANGDIREEVFIDIVFQCMNAMSGLRLSRQPGIKVVTAREIMRAYDFDDTKQRTVANLLGRFLSDRSYAIPDMDCYEHNDATSRDHDNPFYTVRCFARTEEVMAVADKKIDSLSDRYDSGELSPIE